MIKIFLILIISIPSFVFADLLNERYLLLSHIVVNPLETKHFPIPRPGIKEEGPTPILQKDFEKKAFSILEKDLVPVRSGKKHVTSIAGKFLNAKSFSEYVVNDEKFTVKNEFSNLLIQADQITISSNVKQLIIPINRTDFFFQSNSPYKYSYATEKGETVKLELIVDRSENIEKIPTRYENTKEGKLIPRASRENVKVKKHIILKLSIEAKDIQRHLIMANARLSSTPPSNHLKKVLFEPQKRSMLKVAAKELKLTNGDMPRSNSRLFTDIKIQDISFDNASIKHQKFEFDSNDFNFKQGNHYLESNILINSTFENCKFSDTRFDSNSFSNVVFNNCEFKDSLFVKNRFENVVFKNTDFQKVRFAENIFINCSFENIDGIENLYLKNTISRTKFISVKKEQKKLKRKKDESLQKNAILPGGIYPVCGELDNVEIFSKPKEGEEVFTLPPCFNTFDDYDSANLFLFKIKEVKSGWIKLEAYIPKGPYSKKKYQGLQPNKEYWVREVDFSTPYIITDGENKIFLRGRGGMPKIKHIAGGFLIVSLPKDRTNSSYHKMEVLPYPDQFNAKKAEVVNLKEFE